MSRLAVPATPRHARAMDLETALSRLDLRDPTPLAETPRATLWRVRRGGAPAVLKLLTEEGMAANEARAAALLRLWDGRGAVRLLAATEDGRAQVMEVLDGPLLGDMARGGDDVGAARVLAEVARALDHPADPRFPTLEDYGAALLGASDDLFPRDHRATFKAAQAMFHHLLDTTRGTRLLHADLHHDNILRGPRGWVAIDPKGINGDPHYEFANAFRNPIGMEADIADPARVATLAATFARGTDLDPARLIDWAFAHCALSLSWNLERGHAPARDLSLLSLFANLAQAPLPRGPARIT